MTRAMYPGSFDPVTYGHLDIVARASRLFGELVVAVYDAPPKRLFFTTEERVALFREAVRDLPNVQVVPYRGLTVEFARSVGAGVLVRGLRAGSDFENEFEMALMNKKLAPEIESVFLMSSLEWQFLSASRVKEIALLGGDISQLVPPHVARALMERVQRVRESQG